MHPWGSRYASRARRSTYGPDVPKGYTSAEFAEMLIEKTGVVVTPGSGFGDEGEGIFQGLHNSTR